jgi:hypothetical protein
VCFFSSFWAPPYHVLSTDQIRPDWEAKLAAVRAAVTRRANRRIIMRQVGDRLIPVGITSGRVHPINPEEAQAEANEGGGSRRSRRRQQQQQNQELNQFLGSMGLGGQDLEEVGPLASLTSSWWLIHEHHSAYGYGSNAPLAIGPRRTVTTRSRESKCSRRSRPC